MNEKRLKKKIMRRVYTVYYMRQLRRVLAVEVFAFTFFAFMLISRISVSHIIENMPRFSDIPALFRFLTAAFFNTEFVVQVVFVGVAVASFLLLKDIIKIYPKETTVAV